MSPRTFGILLADASAMATLRQARAAFDQYSRCPIDDPDFASRLGTWQRARTAAMLALFAMLDEHDQRHAAEQRSAELATLLAATDALEGKGAANV